MREATASVVLAPTRRASVAELGGDGAATRLGSLIGAIRRLLQVRHECLDRGVVETGLLTDSLILFIVTGDDFRFVHATGGGRIALGRWHLSQLRLALA